MVLEPRPCMWPLDVDAANVRLGWNASVPKKCKQKWVKTKSNKNMQLRFSREVAFWTRRLYAEGCQEIESGRSAFTTWCRPSALRVLVKSSKTDVSKRLTKLTAPLTLRMWMVRQPYTKPVAMDMLGGKTKIHELILFERTRSCIQYIYIYIYIGVGSHIQ